MKKILIIFSISIFLLVLTSILTYNDDRPVDGLQTYGFPFDNYQCCSDCVEGFENGYIIKNIFKNLLIIGLIISSLAYIIQKKKRNMI